MHFFGQDVRYGIRLLGKAPAFTTVALLTLALGMGAATAIFSVVDTVLLKPLPFRDAERLLVIWEKNPSQDRYRMSVAPANFLAWQKQSRTVEQMAAILDTRINLTGGPNGHIDPEEVKCERVSAELIPAARRGAQAGPHVPARGRPAGARQFCAAEPLFVAAALRRRPGHRGQDDSPARSALHSGWGIAAGFRRAGDRRRCLRSPGAEYERCARRQQPLPDGDCTPRRLARTGAGRTGFGGRTDGTGVAGAGQGLAPVGIRSGRGVGRRACGGRFGC